MKQKRERKGKEIDAVFGGNIEEKAEVASAKVEERQQAKGTRRVAGTDVPYVDPPSAKAPR
jgi:hypothetical protein